MRALKEVVFRWLHGLSQMKSFILQSLNEVLILLHVGIILILR